MTSKQVMALSAKFKQLLIFKLLILFLAFPFSTLFAFDLKLLDDFPKPVKFHHLGDWQRFDTSVINATAIKLLDYRGGIFVPDLAESWNVSSDGKEISFKIRSGVIFDDGTPLTSAHAAYAIKRHIALGGQNAPLLKDLIVGASKVLSKKLDVLGIQTPSSTSLVLKLNNSYPDLLGVLSMLSFAIFKEEDLSSTEDNIFPSFKASGPYKLKSASENVLILEKNSKYWNKVLLAKIPERIQISNSANQSVDTLIDGSNDVTRGPAASFDKESLEKKGVQFVRAGLAQSYLVPDFKGPALSKYPELMKLIHILLNRDRLVADQRMSGHFDTTGLNALTAGISILKNEFDQSYSKLRATSGESLARLKTITTEMKSKGIKLSYAVRNSSKYHIDVGENIIKQLESLGIPVEKHIVPTTELTKNENFGTYDLRPLAEMWDTAKPALAIKYILNTNPKSTNIPANHEIFKVANKTPKSYEDHLELMREFNRIALKEGFIIPVLSQEIYLVFSSRIDPSRVPANDLIWYPQDLSIKSNFNDNK
jgi:ABC-type oligopeptide transport system substrate-binding subunit